MTTTPTILVSVTDPVLHPEAINIAAATGMDIIDTSDPRDIVRHAPKAAAILVDATTATHAGGIHPRGHLFLLHPEPGPVDWTRALLRKSLFGPVTARVTAELGLDLERRA